MTVDRKFRDRVTVEPNVACFFASNQPPLFDDASDAWWRRLLLVRCDRRPDEAAFFHYVTCQAGDAQIVR